MFNREAGCTFLEKEHFKNLVMEPTSTPHPGNLWGREERELLAMAGILRDWGEQNLKTTPVVRIPVLPLPVFTDGLLGSRRRPSGKGTSGGR